MNKTIERYPCPLREDLHEINERSRELVIAMRNLRRDLNHCVQCQHFTGCTYLDNFKATVNSAIDEVAEEWNLSSTFGGRSF